MRHIRLRIVGPAGGWPCTWPQRGAKHGATWASGDWPLCTVQVYVEKSIHDSGSHGASGIRTHTDDQVPWFLRPMRLPFRHRPLTVMILPSSGRYMQITKNATHVSGVPAPCGQGDGRARALLRVLHFREATAGFEPAIGVLQTPALPLGYVAMWVLLYPRSIVLSKKADATPLSLTIRWVRLLLPSWSAPEN